MCPRISLSFARRRSHFACTRVCGRVRANDYAYISDRNVTRPAIAWDRSTCIAERRATWSTRHERGMENSLHSLSAFSLPLPRSPSPSLSLFFSVFPFFPPPLYLLQPTIVCIICLSRRGVDKSKRRPRHVPITAPLSFTSSNSPPRICQVLSI